MKYLDPKADLTFKKVFGEHPELVKSLLNALLPFKSEEEEITSVTYLTPEMVPQTPTRKYSIVDVRCEDAFGDVSLLLRCRWFGQWSLNSESSSMLQRHT